MGIDMAFADAKSMGMGMGDPQIHPCSALLLVAVSAVIVKM